MTTHARGAFEVTLKPLPAYESAEGSMLGRMSIDKQFHGDLEGTSKGEIAVILFCIALLMLWIEVLEGLGFEISSQVLLTKPGIAASANSLFLR